MLPNLPKKHNKSEANFGLKFREWIENNPLATSSHIELKDTRGKEYLYIAELTEDQINSALRSKSDKGNLIRISNGTPGAPDYAYYRNAPAIVVIKYPKCFCIIDIEVLLKEKSKSLTEKRARELSTVVFE